MANVALAALATLISCLAGVFVAGALLTADTLYWTVGTLSVTGMLAMVVMLLSAARIPS